MGMDHSHHNRHGKHVHIDAQMRAQLCTQSDFPSLLASINCELTRVGNTFTGCSPFRSERTPSFIVYPPGVGRNGHKGWTYADFGASEQDERSGDQLAFVMRFFHKGFFEAAQFLGERCGVDLGHPAKATEQLKAAPRIETPHIARISGAEQRWAVGRFLEVLQHYHPRSAAEGLEYLDGRGISGETAAFVGGAYRLPGAKQALIARALASTTDDQEIFTKAGLLADTRTLRGVQPSLSWRDDCVLFPCMSRNNEPCWLTARRLDWSAGSSAGKYKAQTQRNGAQKAPYGIPSLMRAAERHEDVYMPEGPTDVLGAVQLGHHAFAALMRPFAYGVDDKHSAVVTLLTPLVPLLQRVKRVIVMPDADTADLTKEAAKAEKSAKIGQDCGQRLVDWMCHRQIPACIGSMAEAGYPLDKDFAETTKRMKVEAVARG